MLFSKMHDVCIMQVSKMFGDDKDLALSTPPSHTYPFPKSHHPDIINIITLIRSVFFILLYLCC